ncbi:hypothetical protein [Anaerolinea sp.]|uniref:hypothetical protein n=1 Tax=Anaerolinea sp. TaxID=1872519 RepID=UPI002ACE9392|nr:hypothetical protein [Anaerolinea sp.]
MRDETELDHRVGFGDFGICGVAGVGDERPGGGAAGRRGSHAGGDDLERLLRRASRDDGGSAQGMGARQLAAGRIVPGTAGSRCGQSAAGAPLAGEPDPGAGGLGDLRRDSPRAATARLAEICRAGSGGNAGGAGFPVAAGRHPVERLGLPEPGAAGGACGNPAGLQHGVHLVGAETV